MEVDRASPRRALWIDGCLVDAEQACVSPFDTAWRAGIGVFETFVVACDGEHGARAMFEAHERRIRTAVAELGLGSFPCFDWCRVFRSLLDRAGLELGRGRLSIHDELARPRCVALVEEVEDLATRREGGVRLVTSPYRFGDDDPTPAFKVESRMLYHRARREAQSRGADDALLVGPDGAVRETTRASVFIVDRSGTLATPPLSSAALPGIVREALLGLAASAGIPSQTRPILRADLFEAEEVLLTNAVVGIEPVRFLDGLAIRGDEDSKAPRMMDRCLQLLRRAGMPC